MVAQLYHQALLRLAGLRWRYVNPPPRGLLCNWNTSPSSRYIAPARTAQKTSLLLLYVSVFAVSTEPFPGNGCLHSCCMSQHRVISRSTVRKLTWCHSFARKQPADILCLRHIYSLLHKHVSATEFHFDVRSSTGSRISFLRSHFFFVSNSIGTHRRSFFAGNTCVRCID
jgi:hypothetical protein